MQRKDPEYGYNYGHFTIADNLSISDDKLRKNLKSYNKGTVWYRRDILGERCAAEGLVYPMFVDNEDDYYIEVEDVPKRDLGYICIGQDFGGNKSKHTFCASAITRDYRYIYVLASEEHNATGTSVKYVEKALDQFCGRIEALYGHVDYVFADSAEQTIINSERQSTKWNIRNSVKNEIVDRIRATDIFLTTKRLKIVKSQNASLIAAMRSATWDPKATDDRRLDIPGKTCPLDAFEYSWEFWIKRLTS
jgi:PBSX family phage terminase large subunit